MPAGVERGRVLYELSLTRQFGVPKWVALCDEALLEGRAPATAEPAQ